MTTSDIITGLLTAFLGLAMWLLKMIFARHDKLREDYDKLALDVARNYIPRDEIAKLLEQIRKDFQDATKQIRDDVNAGFDRMSKQSYRGPSP